MNLWDKIVRGLTPWIIREKNDEIKSLSKSLEFYKKEYEKHREKLYKTEDKLHDKLLEIDRLKLQINALEVGRNKEFGSTLKMIIIIDGESSPLQASIARDLFPHAQILKEMDYKWR